MSEIDGARSAPAVGAKYYRYPGPILVLGWVGAIFCAFVVVCGAIAAWSTGKLGVIIADLGSSLFLLWIASRCVAMIGYARDGFALDEQGLWWLPHNRDPQFTAWADIVRLKVDDFMQRLVVTRRPGGAFQAEYQLTDFQTFSDALVSRAAPGSYLPPETQSVFYVGVAAKLSLTMLLAPLFVATLLSFAAGSRGGLPACALTIGAWIWLTWREPTAVRIGHDAFVIQWLAWRRTIPFAYVQSVSLVDDDSGRNYVSRVTLRLKIGKPIVIARFRDGSLGVYHALRNALDRSRPALGRR